MVNRRPRPQIVASYPVPDLMDDVRPALRQMLNAANALGIAIRELNDLDNGGDVPDECGIADMCASAHGIYNKLWLQIGRQVYICHASLTSEGGDRGE